MTCIYHTVWEDAVRRAELFKRGTGERRAVHREVMYTYSQWFFHSMEPDAVDMRRRLTPSAPA